MMSLSPNIDEPRCSVDTHKPDLVSLTETWVYDDKECGNHPHIPGFNLLLKNRTSGVHGGAGLYINNSIKYKALTDFYHPEFEGLWAHLRPTRLPMGYPCIVFGTVYHTYHPAGASDGAMLDYLATSLTTIEGRYPGCGILITGDFNRLNITCFLAQFKLKQLVRVPTRIERTLDLIITNMTQLYDKDLVKTFSPTGLSDHSVVLLQPKPRSARSTSSCRLSTRRDTRPSRKCEFGRYLGSVDWSTLDSAPDCDSKLQMFNELVKIGLDTIMPLKTYKLHHNDAPWVTAEFKLWTSHDNMLLWKGISFASIVFAIKLIESTSCATVCTMHSRLQTSRTPNRGSGGLMSRKLQEWPRRLVARMFDRVFILMELKGNLGTTLLT